MEDMTRIAEYYRVVSTAEYIAENYPMYAKSQAAFALAQQVRQLMDKTEYSEAEAIREILQRQDHVERDPNDCTIEYCPHCDMEVAIRSKGVTACPECGRPLAPCSVCWHENGGCRMSPTNPDACPYGCTGGEADERKPITAPPMTPEEIAFAFVHC